jgi:hypothetical protein
MDWECAEGHRWRTTAHAIRQGHWCKKCADARLRTPAETVADIAARRGGRCLTPYTNTAARMEWICARGHPWSASLNSVKQGRWCPECARSGRERRNRASYSWVRALAVDASG